MLNLQQRILELLDEQGPCPARDVQRSLKDVDHIALDCGLSALLRIKKITLEAGRYDLARPGSKARGGDRELIPPHDAFNAPGAGQGESKVLPPPETQVCNTCKTPKPVCEFRLTNMNGRRAKDCNGCHGGKTRAGMAKSPAPAPAQPVIADRVFGQVKARRESILEQIENLRAELQACDQFVELYEKFAEGAT